MALNLFIIGPSGCGKSTQARLVADKYKLTHLSMGQLLRDEIASGSELGQSAKDYIDRGVWVPDEVTFAVLKSKLDSIGSSNFILDGYPRALAQGPLIEGYLKEKDQNISLLVHLAVTAQEISRRRSAQNEAGSRFSDAGRTDETPQAIAARQKSYDDSIGPILNYFKEIGSFVEVDGNRPVEPIFLDICQNIDKLL